MDLNLGKVGRVDVPVQNPLVSLFSVQDEKYNHIDESEMKKVEKSVNEVMEWMNNVMNAQAKRSLDQDPVVRTQEIRAKVKVSVSSFVWTVSVTHGISL